MCFGFIRPVGQLSAHRNEYALFQFVNAHFANFILYKSFVHTWNSLLDLIALSGLVLNIFVQLISGLSAA